MTVELGSAHGKVIIDTSGVSAGMATAQRSLQSMRSSLMGIGASFGAVGGMLTMGLTAPLVGVGGAALNMAMDFESAMNMMQAVSGATDEQMQQVAETARALGADLTLPATSAADAATAMVELAKAGLSVEDAMVAAKGALQLAAAGQIEEAQAAAITANALNTFHLAGTEATRVADMLAAGANASSASVLDLAAGFQQAGFAFSAVDLSAEELITSIAALTNVGLTGSDAGTALKNAIMKLAAPTDEGAKLMRALGINVFDAQGRMLPMPAVIDALNRGLAGMTEQERLAALNTMVLSDGAKALIPLLDLGSTGFEELQGKITKEGAAAELAAAQSKGLRGALAGLQSQFETVAQTIAEKYLPTIERVIRGIAELLPKLLDVPPALIEAVVAFGAILAVAGPVALAISGISFTVAALASPFGLVVLAVGALAAAFASNFLGIRDIVSGFWTHIQETLRPVIALVRNVIKVFQMWHRHTGSVVEGIKGALGGLALMAPELAPVTEALRSLVSTLQEKVPAALAGLKAIWDTVWPQLQIVIETVLGFVVTFVEAKIRFIKGIINTGVAIIQANWDEAWGYLAETLQVKFGGIVDFLTGQTGTIVTVMDGLHPNFTNLATVVQGAFDGMGGATERTMGLWERLTEVAQTVWVQVQAAIQGFVDFVGPLVAVHANGILGVLEAAWNGVLALIMDLLPIIESLVSTWATVITGFISEHGTEIQAFMKTTWDSIAQIIALAIEIIRNTIVPAFQAIATFLQEHTTEIEGLLSGAWEIIKSIIQLALDLITGILRTALAIIKGDWEGAWGELRGMVSKIWEDIKGIVNGALEVIKNVLAAVQLPNPFAALREAVDDVWGRIRSFLDWLGSISIPNPFGGISIPSGVAGAGLAAARLGPAGAVNNYGGGSTGNVDQRRVEYHLHVNTVSPAESVIGDFGLMRSWAGAR